MIAALLEGAQRAVVLASTTVPTPGPEFNEDTVTPGLFGFITMLVIALAAVLLALDMVRRVRRTTYTAQVKERLDAEEAERSEG
ncbi:hypothetical protein C5C41_01040 [Rathayibacter sp. AY1E9]|uniref:hypothetical protein n=1 Tax=unclassified Rathayibacter TaxID=2609250 RepID=UPI000CE8644E|nr:MULTISPECIES: hypothetical protein [unclassified Rathayibacter]PPF45614.1 hypothetical protein C5E14_12330 [Rathayibacter sp. AY1A1]PPF59104.1 hypothetical protein C5C55_02275 [Rathayibacter sp. AY1C2]PPG18518.1 hypothetical protein C5D36_00565 [Rathayibacter sp. AY1C6]PPG34740.1 hypothetical protein C5C25_01675 [Rathayibacter sp. AY2B9]PPG55204.1 hypothetical protein C5C41_01040 [Rathayibacter sp. AY1E9]